MIHILPFLLKLFSCHYFQFVYLSLICVCVWALDSVINPIDTNLLLTKIKNHFLNIFKLKISYALIISPLTHTRFENDV